MTLATTVFTGIAVAADGTTYVTGDQVQKLDPSGSPAAAFATNGQAAVRSSAPVLDSAGNVYYIGGDTINGWRGVYALDANGRPITSFGANGLAPLTTLDGIARVADSLIALARDAGGNLYAGGNRLGNLSRSDVAIVKFDKDGRRDMSYGNGGGFNVISFPSFYTSLGGMRVNAAGELLVAGTATDNVRTSFMRGFVAKFAVNGQPIREFGANGAWIDFICQGRGTLHALAFDASSNIVVGGSCSDAVDIRPLLYKLDPAGNVTSFRDSGSRPGLFAPEGVERFTTVLSVIVANNGDIYAGATASLAGTDFCSRIDIAKLDSSGNPVTGFGNGGVAYFQSPSDLLIDLEADAVGRLYMGDLNRACGGTGPPNYRVFRLGP